MTGEFFTWSLLGSYAGATVFVALVTQITKEIPYINKIPTRVWSYLVSLVTLTAATLFTGGWDASALALNVINAVLVALAAQGGYTLMVEGVATNKG